MRRIFSGHTVWLLLDLEKGENTLTRRFVCSTAVNVKQDHTLDSALLLDIQLHKLSNGDFTIQEREPVSSLNGSCVRWLMILQAFI
jgi:hypothetical protein